MQSAGINLCGISLIQVWHITQSVGLMEVDQEIEPVSNGRWRQYLELTVTGVGIASLAVLVIDF